MIKSMHGYTLKTLERKIVAEMRAYRELPFGARQQQTLGEFISLVFG